jgi:hypothetical protein
MFVYLDYVTVYYVNLYMFMITLLLEKGLTILYDVNRYPSIV